SLYGNKPQYLVGAIRNAEQAPLFYPDWECRFYTGPSVPEETKEKLKSLGANLIMVVEREDASAMFWRFRAFFDPEVDYVIVRDADSRLSMRESRAVDQWLESGQDFHILRDHPAHNISILGGLWGAKTQAMRHFKRAFEAVNPVGVRNEDQIFLEQNVYPVARKSSCVHDSFFFREFWRRKFPTKRDGYAFLGEVFDENDQPELASRLVIKKAEEEGCYRLRLKVGSFLRQVGLR
ncbi:MAG: hypothetical protein ACKOA8_19135, partial [Deltaproteobacteria bacterium]